MSGLSLTAWALAAALAFAPAGTAGPHLPEHAAPEAEARPVASPVDRPAPVRRDMQAEAEAALADPDRRERAMAAFAGALIHSVRGAPAGFR